MHSRIHRSPRRPLVLARALATRITRSGIGLALPLAITVAGLAQVGCHGSTSADLPSFADITSAPAPIQHAAEAVVRIETAGEEATGSFISASGLLLTNNHVLGTEICPVEGCYAQLMFDYQRGKPVPTATPVFVVPVEVNVGLDMAVVQVYESAGGAQLSTPTFLTVTEDTPASLMKKHVTLVGHPEGDLKKWSAGEVIDSNGDWIWTTAYLLPGNSGSPILDDAGQMVGIIHRGPTGEDYFTSNGALTYSIGTAGASLVAAMKGGLPPEMISTQAVTTADAVVASDLVYLNGHVTTANVGEGGTIDILEALGTACDAALAVIDYPTPEALATALQPCTDAMSWIECRTDVIATASPASGQECPSLADADSWTQRFTAMNQAYRNLNGQTWLDPVSFGIASLATSYAAGQSTGGGALVQALTDASQPLDASVAVYLAAFSVPSYRGVDLATYLKGYTSIPDYQLSASDIASAAIWMVDNGTMARSDGLAIVASLYGDATVDDGEELYIQTIEYEAGAIN